jgi:phosphatidate cytidylyltransferase
VIPRVLRTRISTAAIALPTVIAVVVFAPAHIFSAFIGLLTAWGLYEIHAMTSSNFTQTVLLVICGGGPAMLLLVAAPAPWMAPLLIIAAMIVLITSVGKDGGENVPRGAFFIVLGALWVGVFFPYFALLRNSRDGLPITILTLLLAVAVDSGAYFVGRYAGRIKLLPKVSPNKTVEGAVGGLGAGLIAGLILRPWLAPSLSIRSICLLSLGVAAMAELGDLGNSAYKRIAGVKDSGWIFPGHGGLLDRTCSLVFAVVLTYYYPH